ncbi:MAG: FAD-dependent oxidoreductase [Oscillospiraceae bacterium]|jgi:2,4-dienoyl-CoA reductase-like NADH-dependent reductase (Old Yellow Enzyme family)/thioredoxin reductase
MGTQFKNLFSPIKVGTQVYGNRIEVAPMGGIELNPNGELERERVFADIDYRASGKPAVFIFGETPVSEAGSRGAHAFYGYDDVSEEHLAPYAEVVDHIHKLRCRTIIELFHAGAAKVDNVTPSLGPMDTVNENGIQVKGMTADDIRQCCEDFATASFFLKKAGFDGVLIHAGHGWLLHQFLSIRTNQRTDEYGGSIENRSRLTVEVLRAIRDKCGPEFNIEVRISGSEHAEGGYSVEDVCEFARHISKYCDLIHVSAGLYRDPMRTWMISTLYQPHFCNADVAAAIKKCVDIPVAVVGGINSPEEAERLISKGDIDMVVLGRQMRADPLWSKKAEAGRSDEIRRCLRCMRCFPGPIEEAIAEMVGGALGAVQPTPDIIEKLLTKVAGGCSVNPYSMHPNMKDVQKADKPKKVLIVGGGVAGLQAAVTAAERGHIVTLIEKTGVLGGVLNYAQFDADKADLYNFARTMEAAARNRKVEIRLNTGFSEELLDELSPDFVIVAIGSSDACPPIPGLENAISAVDAYAKDAKIGERVLVLGGGSVGCETAIHLAKQGKHVRLIEMRGELAPDAYRLHKHILRDLMADLVQYDLNTTCVSVSARGAEVKDSEGKSRIIEADTVIAALGRKANPTGEIQKACNLRQIPHIEIGDCVEARKIFDAVDDGFMVAMKL